MRKEAVKVTPGDIIAPGETAAPKRGGTKGRSGTGRATGTAAGKSTAKAAGKSGRRTPAPAAAVATQARPAAPASDSPPGTRPASALGTPAAAPAPEQAAQPAVPEASAAAPLPEAPTPATDAAESEGQEEGASRRNFFRLDVFGAQVRFELESVGEETPKPATVRGSLEDVSAGGLRLSADTAGGPMPDWPVGAGIFGHLQFSLIEDQPAFDLPARLVRRVETTSGFEFAFAWDHPVQPEIDRLVRDLYQMEVRRRASIPDDRRPKRSLPHASRPGTPHRQPVLIGAALGLAAAVALSETVAQPVVAPVLGLAAVIVAAAYLLVGG